MCCSTQKISRKQDKLQERLVSTGTLVGSSSKDKLKLQHAYGDVADAAWMQCFDITTPSEARAGSHQPLPVEPKDLPRWSKALTQYRYMSDKNSSSKCIHTATTTHMQLQHGAHETV